MKKMVSVIVLTSLMFSMLTLAYNTLPVKAENDEPLTVEWSKRYPGAGDVRWGDQRDYSLIQTTNGGYAIASTYFGAGEDFWLIKTDSTGNMEWNKTYGGAGRECAYSLVQTSDGGYAMAGGMLDAGPAWLVKTDVNGNMQWNKTYAEIGNGQAWSLIQTNDGGYAMAGPRYYYDGWLAKTDANGTMQWFKIYAEANNTILRSVVQTSDGGYILAGATQYPPLSGKVEAYVVKTDSYGNIEWDKTFSATAGHDYGWIVIQTNDGGYAIAGRTDEWGNSDAWLIKIDAMGNLAWDKTYGGTSWDAAGSIVQTSDGGYALAGETMSFGAGGNDFWLVKTDVDGNMLWNETYGGTGDDKAPSVIQTSDGGYALAGYTNSFGASGYDVWLIKLAPSSPSPPIADFNWFPSSPITNESITFDASSSQPGWNGTHTMPIVEYRWDFGDGNTTSTPNFTITHIYVFSGIFNVTLTVFDGAGLNSSNSKIISTRMPTFVSISTSSSSTYAGFRVFINGTLCDLYGNALENKFVVLYYTFPGVTTWFPITSGITDNLGNYYVQWIPYATGYFTLKAEWSGNATHLGASKNITLSVIPYANQYIFSVESNSTISALAFNTTNWELSFTATGPNGTRGYVKVTVAKSLIANITNIRVYLNGNQSEYSITSIDDSWLLTFNYMHSTHQVVVDLDINIVPEFPSVAILLLFIVFTALSAIAVKKKNKKYFCVTTVERAIDIFR